MIVENDINALYINACAMLQRPYYVSNPRGQKVKECTNVLFKLLDPYSRIVSLPERGLSMKYLAGELSFYLAGSDDLAFISHYSKFWNKVTDDGKTVNSAYGKRLFKDKYNGATQFDYALSQLLKDQDTRKAVMMIYDSSDNLLVSNDNPCTLSLQFFIREGALHLTVCMRSNDVWFGFPYDVAFFTFVQERMLVAYNIVSVDTISMGTYTHFDGSFHAYEKDWEKIDACAASTGEDCATLMPRMSEAFELELPILLHNESAIREKRNDSIDKELFVDPMIRWILDILEGEK